MYCSALAVTSVALAVSGTSEASPSTTAKRPGNILWSTAESGRTVTIAVQAGYCVGEPPPNIASVRVREKPASGRAKAEAIIEAFLSPRTDANHPTTVEGVEGAPVETEICEGLEHLIKKRIKLRRPVAELVLLDGYYAPPRRIPSRFR